MTDNSLETTLLKAYVALGCVVCLGVVSLLSWCTYMITQYSVALGPSMEPTIMGNGFIAIETVAFEELQIGDIVVYDSGQGYHICHRIMALTDTYVICQGDNNPVPDPDPVAPEQIKFRVTGVHDDYAWLVTLLYGQADEADPFSTAMRWSLANIGLCLGFFVALYWLLRISGHWVFCLVTWHHYGKEGNLDVDVDIPPPDPLLGRLRQVTWAVNLVFALLAWAIWRNLDTLFWLFGQDIHQVTLGDMDRLSLQGDVAIGACLLVWVLVRWGMELLVLSKRPGADDQPGYAGAGFWKKVAQLSYARWQVTGAAYTRKTAMKQENIRQKRLKIVG